MTIFDLVKSKTTELRKQKSVHAPSLLYVVSKIQEAAKSKTVDGVAPTPTDADSVSVIKKEITKDKEILGTKGVSEDQIASINERLTILESFIPAQVGETEILKELNNLFSNSDKSIKQMGKAMSHLKTTFGINLDSALASRTVKEYLST